VSPRPWLTELSVSRDGGRPGAAVFPAQQDLSLTEREIEALAAEEVLLWAVEEFGDRLCLSCSWQKQSSVLVHMVSELALDVDVIELDTHLFFKETYETRERLVERYGLALIRPQIITVAEQHAREGANLWESDPDRCCHIRKVEPLIQALEPYDAWVSGIRRDQSPSRADSRKAEYSTRYGVWKIQPLAEWTEKDVWRYIVSNDIPYNPLHDAGYRSIGCIPCTRPIRNDEEERAGRWAGSDKLECGIHLEEPDERTA
jgi:phosphoadenosine phosphosulfate reductase